MHFWSLITHGLWPFFWNDWCFLKKSLETSFHHKRDPGPFPWMLTTRCPGFSGFSPLKKTYSQMDSSSPWCSSPLDQVLGFRNWNHSFTHLRATALLRCLCFLSECYEIKLQDFQRGHAAKSDKHGARFPFQKWERFNHWSLQISCKNCSYFILHPGSNCSLQLEAPHRF